ncbi:hypothetical protein Pst134EA_009079 [Puccinia striiformis f. sp. tritici]|uniref:hypothetical protein n=1 Tax=Puccinia striiformis f. sp. tritici TaxID=168172 RepID=UPI000A126622|nr:hypothetical protein Pst134EA_009079 [Puccinia striiformis f. sp. tritici]KAH9468541.1 hypothetical protein Pst134EA_009079 [Puccinia striiformis f. sp. tritici]
MHGSAARNWANPISPPSNSFYSARPSMEERPVKLMVSRHPERSSSLSPPITQPMPSM